MKLRPDPGWTRTRHVGVYQHTTGVQVHTIGLICIPHQAGVRHIFCDTYPCSQIRDRWIRIAGGNRKRGLMLWAMDEFRKLQEEQQ
jgi:hypothetical protein